MELVVWRTSRKGGAIERSSSEFQRRGGWPVAEQIVENASEIGGHQTLRSRRDFGDGPPSVSGDRVVLQCTPAGAIDGMVRDSREEPVVTGIGERAQQ